MIPRGQFKTNVENRRLFTPQKKDALKTKHVMSMYRHFRSPTALFHCLFVLLLCFSYHQNELSGKPFITISREVPAGWTCHGWRAQKEVMEGTDCFAMLEFPTGGAHSHIQLTLVGIKTGRFCFPSVKCRHQCLWMTPREAVRCDELLAELCLPVHQNSMILNYPISLARTALISPAWRANMSLTTKTRCGLPSEGAQDFYKHLTWL